MSVRELKRRSPEQAMLDGHEQVLLSALMKSHVKLPVSEQDFWSPPNRSTFIAIAALGQNRGWLAVADELKRRGILNEVGGEARLIDIFDLRHDSAIVDYALGEVLEASRQRYSSNGVPVIRGSNLSLGEVRFRGDEFVYVPDEVADRLRRSTSRPLDIIFTKKGTIGQTGIVPAESRYKRYLLSGNQLKLTVDRNRADPMFVYYWVSSPASRDKIIRDSTVTGVPKTNLAYLKTFPIRLPPLAEQKAIAAVLGALDEKIELNRRMNATLEAMARALFQSWFIDFDPVRAKLDGRQPTDVGALAGALFPNEFQDSPIGLVPNGWKVDRFDAHITAERGLSYSGDGLREDGTGLPMHNLNSIYEGGGYKHEGIKYYAGEYREKHMLKPGDMIVTNTEQGFDHLLIGHAAIVPDCYGPTGLYSHHIYRVRTKPNSPFTNHYLVHLFNSRRWHYWISGFSNGTTINMLPRDALRMPLLVVPPVPLVEKFTSVARAAHERVETNIKQSLTLAAIRNALLPKLLSGEVSVFKR